MGVVLCVWCSVCVLVCVFYFVLIIDIGLELLL